MHYMITVYAFNGRTVNYLRQVGRNQLYRSQRHLFPDDLAQYSLATTHIFCGFRRNYFVCNSIKLHRFKIL